jgi:hypothetical protein
MPLMAVWALVSPHWVTTFCDLFGLSFGRNLRPKYSFPETHDVPELLLAQ